MDLSRCVAAAFGTEDLSKQGYTCSKCKSARCARESRVWRSPKVLVVTLKRFTFSAYRRAKSTASVALPPAGLDLSPVCAPASPAARGGTDYELWGVVNHSGSLNGGHYTADCRNLDTGRWYTFNDSRVTPTSEPRGGSAPYVLFYVRKGEASRPSL